MKNDKLMPGLILVLIGAIFLMHNFGLIHFHWYNLWRMWPVFLVIAGVNLVFANNRSPWATILKIAVVIAGFALVIFGNFSSRYGWWPRYTYHYNNNDNDDNDYSDDDEGDNSDDRKIVKVEGNSTFNEPYSADVKVARLNVSGGATNYKLNDTTNSLFKAITKEHRGRYEMNTRKDDSIFVVDFKMKNAKVWNWDNKDDDSNTANIMLNTTPIWEVNVDAGATDLNFDLSKYKVRSVKLNGGAGQFVLRMGQPLDATNINVSSAAADVTIEIPNGAACQIESSTGLSSNTFDGFTKKDNGHFETANFGSAKNRMYIHISGVAGDFKVHTY